MFGRHGVLGGAIAGSILVLLGALLFWLGGLLPSLAGRIGVAALLVLCFVGPQFVLATSGSAYAAARWRVGTMALAVAVAVLVAPGGAAGTTFTAAALLLVAKVGCDAVLEEGDSGGQGEVDTPDGVDTPEQVSTDDSSRHLR